MTITSQPSAITKNIGQLSFFEKTWTQTFDLSLQSYIDNAILLQNVTLKLVDICKNIKDNKKCQYFKKNVEKNAIMAQKDLDLLVHNRTKRFWSAIAAFGRGFLKQALYAVGIIGVSELIHKNELDGVKEELKVQKNAIIAMHELNKLRNNLSIESNDELHHFLHQVNDISSSTNTKENLHDLLDMAKDASTDHYLETTKFMRIINNDYRKYFFNIIEMDSFLHQIKEIDSHPITKLPTLNPYKLLDLSYLTYTNNETHVSLVIEMPIASNQTYTLHEFIPISRENNKKTRNFKNDVENLLSK